MTVVWGEVGRGIIFPKCVTAVWDSTPPKLFLCGGQQCSMVILSLDPGDKCLEASSEYAAFTTSLFLFYTCSTLPGVLTSKTVPSNPYETHRETTFHMAFPVTDRSGRCTGLLVFSEHCHLPLDTSSRIEVNHQIQSEMF